MPLPDISGITHMIFSFQQLGFEIFLDKNCPVNLSKKIIKIIIESVMEHIRDVRN